MHAANLALAGGLFLFKYGLHYTSDNSSLSGCCTEGTTPMAKTSHTDATFALMFIANAKQCIDAEQLDWAMAALNSALDALKLMKKTAAANATPSK
jgi:hypothetical protein